MIRLEDKLLVNNLVTYSIKILPKVGILGMNEKSLEYSNEFIEQFELLINKMQRTKDKNYDDDISMLIKTIEMYKESIEVYKKSVNDLNKEVSEYHAAFLSLEKEIEQKIESNK